MNFNKIKQLGTPILEKCLKSIKILVDDILNRESRGYAFSNYPINLCRFFSSHILLFGLQSFKIHFLFLSNT